MNKTRVFVSQDGVDSFLCKTTDNTFVWEMDLNTKYPYPSFQTMDLAINAMRKSGKTIMCRLIKN